MIRVRGDRASNTERMSSAESAGISPTADQVDRHSLEAALFQETGLLQIDLIGVGEIPADSALLIRSVLLARSPRTRIITNARSSLPRRSVLVWLLGDSRIIRDDARVYFRRTDLSDLEEAEPNESLERWESKFRDSYSELDPEEGDYARVLQLINEFPAGEGAVRPAHWSAGAAGIWPRGKTRRRTNSWPRH